MLKISEYKLKAETEAILRPFDEVLIRLATTLKI